MIYKNEFAIANFSSNLFGGGADDYLLMLLNHLKTASVFLLLVVFSTITSSVARAKDKPQDNRSETQAALGFRIGVSALTQDITTSTEGDAGASIGLDYLYNFNPFVAGGLAFEWEGHKVKALGIDLGHLNSFFLGPFVRLQAEDYSGEAKKPGFVTPYASLALGANINTFNESDNVAGSIEPSNTFGLRLAGGLDVTLSENVLMTVELSWKRNDGDYQIRNTSGRVLGNGDFNASSFSALFGIRYRFAIL